MEEIKNCHPSLDESKLNLIKRVRDYKELYQSQFADDLSSKELLGFL